MRDLSSPSNSEQMGEPVTRGGSTCSPDVVRLKGRLRGPFSLMRVDELVAFSQPLIHDASTAFVVLSREVIRQVHGLGCRLVFWGVGTPHLGNNPIVRLFRSIPTLFTGHKNAGTTTLVVFER